MKIYCCTCESDVEARLTDGREVYHHRQDLWPLPFWKCDGCGLSVGCHHKTKNKRKPLGVIPSREIKEKRSYIHSILDPIWKMGRMRRSDVYSELSKKLGKKYHTAEIRSKKEAEVAINAIKEIRVKVGLITF